MLCPKCGYMMDAFDVECPRCKRIAAEGHQVAKENRQREVIVPKAIIPEAPPIVKQRPAPVVYDAELRAKDHPQYGLFIGMAVFLPIVGLIMGIIKACQQDQHDRALGGATIIWSIMVMFISSVIWGVLIAFVNGQ